MMNTVNRPSYFVDFNASICNFEILINDMPAFLQHEGGSIISQYPINSFIYRSGEQGIKIRILPLKGEKTLRSNGSVTIKVQYYDLEASPDQAVEIFTYQTPDLSAAKLPLIEVRQVFKAVVPYQQLAWENSVTLEKGQATIDNATRFYKKVYELIKAEDYGPFLHLMEQRLQEVDESTYTLNANNEKEWNELIQQIRQSEMLLADFPAEVVPVFYGDGRVLNLTRPDGSTIINFRNDKHEEFQFPIYVHQKTAGAPFAIIR